MSIFRKSPECYLGVVALVTLGIIMASKISLAQEAGRPDTTLKQMLTAVKTNSYDQFMAQADSKFKAGFTNQMFESLNRQLGPKLERGYSAKFLGNLNQGGYVVQVWKLEFKDGNDDFLITLFVKEGKVGGFWAR